MLQAFSLQLLVVNDSSSVVRSPIHPGAWAVLQANLQIICPWYKVVDPQLRQQYGAASSPMPPPQAMHR